MKMKAPVAGQTFNLYTGHNYRADEHSVIHDVDPDDVGELERVGCVRIADEPVTPEPRPTPPSPVLPKPSTPMPQPMASAPKSEE
jgi:hypothetical protein